VEKEEDHNNRGPTQGKTNADVVQRKPGRPLGYKVSEETKQKLREKATGRTLSPETKAKIAKAHKGVARSQEARVAISRGQYRRRGAQLTPSPKSDDELTPEQLALRQSVRQLSTKEK